MLKSFVQKWDSNKDKLRDVLSRKTNNIDYKTLVELTFEVIYNEGTNDAGLDIKSITEIDNGNYQGTLLYLIPFDYYQPDACDYLMTYVGYGSCSVCDTLKSILDWDEDEDEDEDKLLTSKQVDELMTLCKDIITNTIKPYNYGWRKDEGFDPAEEGD